VTKASGSQILNICGALMTKSEFEWNPCKTKCTFGCTNGGENFLKHRFLFKEIKYLHTFMKNRILLLVVYAENKPIANYAER
jgi:hypothetical protein